MRIRIRVMLALAFVKTRAITKMVIGRLRYLIDLWISWCDNGDRLIWRSNLNLVCLEGVVYSLPKNIHARRAEFFFCEHFVDHGVSGSRRPIAYSPKRAREILLELGAIELGPYYEFMQDI